MSEDFAAPAWYPDPTGRHDRRWWTGEGWTGWVEDGGQRLFDMSDLPPGRYQDSAGDPETRGWDGTRWIDDGGPAAG